MHTANIASAKAPQVMDGLQLGLAHEEVQTANRWPRWPGSKATEHTGIMNSKDSREQSASHDKQNNVIMDSHENGMKGPHLEEH